MKKIFLVAITILFFNSCSSDYSEVEFKEITNVKLDNIKGATIELTGDCVLYNPNGVALDLTDATFNVYVDGRKTAVMSQELDVKMPAGSDFILPLKATIDAKEFYGEQGAGLFRAAMQVLAKQKVTIKYDGAIKAGKGWAKFPVKIVDSVEVPVKISL